MANPTIFTAEQGFLGLGKESSNGTAVTPTRFLPYRKFDSTPNSGLIIDDAMRGSMVGEYGGVAGPQSTTHSLDTYFYADAIGDLLDNMLGDYAVSGASAPYTHTFAVKNDDDGQPQAHTLTDYQGITASVGARAFAYGCLSELTFSGNAAGLVEVQGTWTSYIGTAASATPTNSVTTSKPTAGWQSSVTVAGSAAAIREWSVTMTRELVVDHLANGSQDPNTISRKVMTVSGKLTFAASNEQPLIDYLAGTEQAVAITITNDGAGASLEQLVLTSTTAAYETGQMVRETPIGWEMSFKGFGNGTDVGASSGESPIKAVLQNAITTYT